MSPPEPEPIIVEFRCRKCGAEFALDLRAMHGERAWEKILHGGGFSVHLGCPEAPAGRESLAGVVTVPILPVTKVPQRVVPIPQKVVPVPK